MLIDLLLCDEDRQRYGAPEALLLDTERLRDQPAKMLIRWEAECGYSIERALAELISSDTPPAAAVMVCVWLARKQMGPDGGGQGDDGRPELYSALQDLKTMRLGYRLHQEPEPEQPEPAGDDADPPAPSPAG